ncbi:hypothetical protein BD770DRAFT_382766 [Pilaira anomala]|nr:hypothetical protein BD770DRAFT_382766 [Pilaira anomala]
MNEEEEEEEDGSTQLGKRRRKTAVPGQGSSRRRQAASGNPDELSERDRRAITRAVLKYGDLEARYDDAVSDFDLGQKDKDTILNLYHDLIQECRAKVREQAEANDSSLKGVEVSEEVLLRELRHTKQKAILFTWHDVQSVNAGQIFQRHHDMKILARRLNSVNDKYKFRVSTGAKRVQGWSCNWGAKEDAMLLVGVHEHGFGSWSAIQADKPLGLSDKFFIGGNDSDEKKTPKAIHLVRRADQMMKILAEEDRLRNDLHGSSEVSRPVSKRGPNRSKARPEHHHHHQHNNNHHHQKANDASVSTSSTAVTNNYHYNNQHHQQQHTSTNNGSIPEHSSSVTSFSSRKRSSRTSDDVPRPSHKRVEKENKTPVRIYEDYNEELCYSTMRSVKHYLIRLRDDSVKEEGVRKAQIIKECLAPIGQFIDKQAIEHKRDANLKRDLWIYTAKFWPGVNVSHNAIMNVYEKLVASSPTSTTEPNATKTNIMVVVVVVIEIEVRISHQALLEELATVIIPMIEAVEMTEVVGMIEVVETTEAAKMNVVVVMIEEEDLHLHLTRVAMNEPIEMTEVTEKIEAVEIDEEDPPPPHLTRVVMITIVVTEKVVIAVVTTIVMTEIVADPTETDVAKQLVKI